MKACWTCRRRRLKCPGDGKSTRCQRCEADDIQCYAEKPLKWAGSFFVKGPENVPSSPIVPTTAIAKSDKEALNIPHRTTQIQKSSALTDKTVVAKRKLLPQVKSDKLNSRKDPIISRSLIDPIFKDLNHDVRFFVRYCTFVLLLHTLPPSYLHRC
jgi:hypothetical protein